MTYDELVQSPYTKRFRTLDLEGITNWEIRDEYEITTISNGQGTGPLSDEKVLRLEHHCNREAMEEFWFLHTDEGHYTFDMKDNVELYVVKLVREDIGVI